MATRIAVTNKVKTKAKIRILAVAETTKKHRQRVPAPTQKAIELFPEPSKTDVNGSYTGRPKNKREIPVQDADDL